MGAGSEDDEPLSKTIGEGISKYGETAYGGIKPYQPGARPAAARMDAEAPIAPFNAEQSSMQRQQLAMLMQRLNSGRLF